MTAIAALPRCAGPLIASVKLFKALVRDLASLSLRCIQKLPPALTLSGSGRRLS
jgi:hypothetical protein